VAAVVVLTLLCFPASGSVVKVQPPDKLFEGCTVVFGGRLESVRELGADEKGVPRHTVYEYRFTVGQVWKGPLEKQFVVYSRERMSRVRDGSYCLVYCYIGHLAFGADEQLETADVLCSPIREATYDRVVLREPHIVDATLAVARPSVAELESMSAEANLFVSSPAKKALRHLENLESEAKAHKER
jgi:hypothetical protein